ncbi:MAG: EamA family transporter [Candidatus Nanopelagicales bacterium]|nr:EamA family transporter [Candidatus Nanopelagicales bacterium]MDP4986263.1 EamA family transporter [Candidatus Nanopelagicales bacterium]MDP5107517.1 EamA family transporter [Candidatus Nanopelagicales bacterium]
MATVTKRITPKVWIALVTVYLVWGSTYLGIALVIKTAPPLLSMGLRFVAAFFILALILLIFKGKSVLKVTRPELMSSIFLGGLLLGFGIGNLTLAERYVPSGIAALIIAALPIWVTIFQRITGVRPKRITLVGIFLGLIGVAIIVLPGGAGPAPGADPSKVKFWMFMILIGNIAWAFGTFMTQRIPIPKDPFVLTTYEMLFGGLALIIASFFNGERFKVELITQMSPTSKWAWIYLVLIGSIVGYGAYIWLLNNTSLSLASTYAYVNPVIAVMLGLIVLSEPVDWPLFLGGAVVLSGVALVVSGERFTNLGQ